MPSEPHSASVSSSALWAGGIITGLVVLFLLFDGVTKIIKVTPVVQACEELGVPAHTVVGIGVLLVVCTAIYAVPQTAVLGAILLTGYLGGAAAGLEAAPFHSRSRSDLACWCGWACSCASRGCCGRFCCANNPKPPNSYRNFNRA